MKSKKKNKKKSSSFNPFKEIFYLIKSFFIAIISILETIGNIILSIYEGIKFIVGEIVYMISSFFEGIIFILKSTFRDVPTKIFGKLSKWLYNKIRNKEKYIKELDKSRKLTADPNEVVDPNMIFSGKGLLGLIKDFIIETYENLSFVKKKREKLEKNLSVLVVDQDGEDAIKGEKKITYRYLARNKEGKLIKGYFSALSRLDVYSYLIDEGLIVYEITTDFWIRLLHSESSSLKFKMSHKDLIFWLTQVSTYVKAGIPLADSVKIIARQDKKTKYKAVFDSVIYELTMGNSFSDALAKQGSIFPPLLVNMIKSSEMIGNIEETLDQMAAYYQEMEDNRKAVIGALTYPVIILVFAICIVVFLLVYIIPKFVQVYSTMGSTVPKLTQTILNISAFITSNWAKILLVILIIIFAIVFAYKNLKQFRTTIQYIFMHLPVFGKLTIYREISMFATTFATLEKNNILLTDSVNMLMKITKNEIFKSIMYNTINNILVGEKMSKSFKDQWCIPQIAYYMIVTGESTGELSAMLEKVGEYYQKQQKNIISQIKTFIEPVMIVLLALIVGFILISVLLPMIGSYDLIK